MKSLLLLPVLGLALLIVLPIIILLLLLGVALFAPIIAGAGIAELPSKFYDYGKN